MISHYFHTSIDFIFGISLFINAALFLPQAYKIIKLKNSEDLSLITFIGFCLGQACAILYGLSHHDLILTIGYSLSLLTCATVTFLICIYNKPNTTKT